MTLSQTLLSVLGMSGLWIIGIILVLILCSVGAWLMYRWLLYNKEVWVFENINGKGYVVTFKDKARLIKFGKTGEEVLYLRGKKVYRTAYGRKMGNNTYWFAVGQDGYWYNFVLGDLDAKREMLDIEPIDRDVRMMYVAMSKNVEERFNKPSFLDKYGTYLASGIIILLLLGSMWFLLNKMSDNLSQTQAYDTERQKVDLQIVQELKGITIAFEQLNAQSGIRPVQVS